MDVVQSIFFLFMCTVLQLTLGQATETYKKAGIIGGHAIEIEEAPFMAGFVQDGEIVCAGSIVHRQFILTSASCAKTRYPLSTAHVGSNQARIGGHFIDVEDMVCHKEFDKRTLDNNICLLKLRTPVSIGNGIAIVDLPVVNSNTAPGTTVNVTGWGSMDNTGGSYSITLLHATLSVLPDESCFPYAPNMTQNMLCVGLEGGETCTGDGGGPLTQNNVQIGIVSFGPGNCGKFPTVYTEVSKYVTWITTTIQNNL